MTTRGVEGWDFFTVSCSCWHSLKKKSNHFFAVSWKDLFVLVIVHLSWSMVLLVAQMSMLLLAVELLSLLFQRVV